MNKTTYTSLKDFAKVKSLVSFHLIPKMVEYTCKETGEIKRHKTHFGSFQDREGNTLSISCDWDFDPTLPIQIREDKDRDFPLTLVNDKKQNLSHLL